MLHGIIKKRIIYLKNKSLRKYFLYFSNKQIKKIGQSIFINKPMQGDHIVKWVDYGKWELFFKNGKIKNLFCLTPVHLKEYDIISGEKCGLEIIYNKDGSIKKKIQHKYKCKYGCEEIKVPVKYLKQ